VTLKATHRRDFQKIVDDYVRSRYGAAARPRTRPKTKTIPIKAAV